MSSILGPTKTKDYPQYLTIKHPTPHVGLIKTYTKDNSKLKTQK